MAKDKLDSLIDDAHEAAANVLSEYGTPGMDTDVVTAIERAIEVGYVLALRDVRDGNVEP